MSAGGGPQVLDAQALARLAELDPGGKAGLVKRVLATYAQSLARLLPQLQAARASADLPALRHAAHTLKSSSASVGALALSALCAEVEARLRDGQGDGLDDRLGQLVAEAERIHTGLLHAAAAPAAHAHD
jgi:HPt (histidine-containing phosphotransfer) domain-containing protein